MSTCIILAIGILIGWITKLPFAIKWYKELKQYKIKKVEMYNRIMDEIHKLPKDEQAKYHITTAYFRDTP
jgi:hypothetical protein